MSADTIKDPPYHKHKITNELHDVVINTYDEIITELNKLKDLLPYSNNNDLYNSAIEMCIKAVKVLKKEKIDAAGI